MAKRISLATWLKNAVSDPDKGGKCVMITLVHMLNGGSQTGKELHTVRIGGSRNWTEKELAEMLEGVAQAFSQDLVGTQTFQVQAYYEGDNSPKAFFHIKANAVVDVEGDNVSEPPTREGRMAQTMRQEGQVFNQLFSRQQQLDNTTTGLINFLGGNLIEVMKENREAIGLVKEMMMRQAVENREHELAVLKYKRASEERKTFMKMAPPLVNTITGKDIFPVATEDTAIVEALADSIPIEQVRMVSSMLPPQVAALLMSRLERHAEKRLQEAKNEQEAKKPLIGRNPEDDSVGD